MAHVKRGLEGLDVADKEELMAAIGPAFGTSDVGQKELEAALAFFRAQGWHAEATETQDGPVGSTTWRLTRGNQRRTLSCRSPSLCFTAFSGSGDESPFGIAAAPVPVRRLRARRSHLPDRPKLAEAHHGPTGWDVVALSSDGIELVVASEEHAVDQPDHGRTEGAHERGGVFEVGCDGRRERYGRWVFPGEKALDLLPQLPVRSGLQVAQEDEHEP